MKKILIVAPHADDEVLGCYGWIKKSVSRGYQVDIAIMCLGDSVRYSGEPDLKSVRIKEVAEVHSELGVKNTFVFSDKDGYLNTIPLIKIVGFLDNLLKEEYDTILAPFASHHQDHQITLKAVESATRLKEGKRKDPELILYLSLIHI